jgi:glycosyltransferase involved in cell wall biosynthesis
VLRYAAGLKHVLGRNPQNIVLSGDMFGNCAVAEVQKILGRQSVRSVVSIHSYVLQRKEPDGETSNAGGESENGSVRSVPSGPWPRDYVSRCLQQVDEVIAVSDGLVDEVVDLMGAGFSVTRIYDPVITERLRCLSAGPPEHPWAKRKEAPLVVSVGRFGPQKDFLFLLEAFALVRARRDVRLMLIGYNAKSMAHRVYKAKLEEKAKRLRIADSITMLPAMENPYALMRAADVYVSSSPAEGFGNVLVEALYCGVPIVSTDCPGGPREILDDGEYGALTPAGDAKAMADAICNALDYPPERSVLSERAELFSLDRALAKYQEVLERLPPFDG